MRPAARLLGIALGLVRSRCPPTRVYAPPIFDHPCRRYAVTVDGPPANPDDPDVKTALAKAEATLYFPHLKTFVPSRFLKQERDKRFPPTQPHEPQAIPSDRDSSSTSSTDEIPPPKRRKLQSHERTTEGWINSARQNHNYYVALRAFERRYLRLAYEPDESVHTAEGDAQIAEQAAKDAQLADDEERLALSLSAAAGAAEGNGSSSPPPTRMIAAVPWVTHRFRLSNALVADSWVERPGLDITTPEQPVVKVEEDEGAEKEKEKEEEEKKTKKKTKPKPPTADELQKLRMQERAAKEARKAAKPWLLRVFGAEDASELNTLSRADWDAARRYYEGLEAEIESAERHELQEKVWKRFEENKTGNSPGASLYMALHEREERERVASLGAEEEEEEGEEEEVDGEEDEEEWEEEDTEEGVEEETEKS